jgi:excisionase family DNA binding protein
MKNIITLLEEIKLLLQQNKQMLNVDEASVLSGICKTHLYRLVEQGKLKSYKPFGKLIYFDRDELINSLKQNATKSQDEISIKATNYLFTSKSKRNETNR